MEENNYTLEQDFGAISDDYFKTVKKVTLGYWSNTDLRLDIRSWRGAEIQKGISLTEDEVRELRRILDEIDFGR